MKNSELTIIVTGTSGTGKTKFVDRYTKNIFSDVYKATIVSEYGYKEYEKNGKSYRIKICDLAGQDRNGLVTRLFARDAHGCIILSDASYTEIREDALRWKNCVDEAATFLDGGKLPCILAENKSDLIEDKESKEKEIKDFAEKNGFDGGFLVSSKLGENINESVEYLIDKIIERMELVKDEDIIISRKSLPLDPERYNEFILKQEKKKKKKEKKEEIDMDLVEIDSLDLQTIEFDDLGGGLFEIYSDTDEQIKYSYKNKLKELKKQYPILNNIKNVKKFINILEILKEKNKMKINLYLKNIVIQISIIFTSIFGDEEEITFELISEDIKEKDLLKYLTKFLIKIRESKNNINNKSIDSSKNEIKED